MSLERIGDANPDRVEYSVRGYQMFSPTDIGGLLEGVIEVSNFSRAVAVDA